MTQASTVVVHKVEALVALMDWQKAHELYVSKKWKWGLRGETHTPTPEDLRTLASDVLKSTLAIHKGRRVHMCGRIFGRKVGEALELFFGSSKTPLMLVRWDPTQPEPQPSTFTKFEFEPPV